GEDVFAAIRGAKSGPVEEGAVGAGAGTVAFGFKGGIGTASRKLPHSLGGYTVGVLVQTNFGGVLSIDGAPVGKELGRYYLHDAIGRNESSGRLDSAALDKDIIPHDDDPNGSCMIVVATDAPLDARQLRRLAARAILGMARVGSTGSSGSGDYVIAFSTANRLPPDVSRTKPMALLSEDSLSPLFEAAIDATEEAIVNSLLRATTVRGFQNHQANALPMPQLRQVLGVR